MKILKIIFAILIITKVVVPNTYAQNEPIKIFTLSGTVVDDSTFLMIPSAKVTIKGSDGTINIGTTDALGKYEFDSSKIKANTAYEIKVEKSGYFGARGKESTKEIESSKNIVHNFNLVPIPILGDPLPEIRFGNCQYELLPQLKDSLIGFVNCLKDNPHITIEITARIYGCGTKENMGELSFKRAKAVIDYLIAKGIEADRLQIAGNTKANPRTVYIGMTVNGVYFPRGTVFTDEYIEKLKVDKKKYEAALVLNNVVEFSILRTNYIPKVNNPDKKEPVEIKIKTE